MNLKARRPVAVLLSRFPLITETFILREIVELENQGQPVVLVPMIREHAEVVHEEAKPWIARALFTPWISPAIALAVLRALLIRPATMLGLLWWIVRGCALHPGTMVRSFMLLPKSVYLAERLTRLGIEHMHAHFATHPATMASIIHALTGISFSFTVHAHDIFVDRSLLREKMRNAAFVRAVSAFNKRFLESLYPAEAGRKIEVVHVGIETAKYAEAPSDDDGEADPHIVCIAALKPYKGIAYLVEACRMLAEERVPFRCDVIGIGPLRNTIRRAIVKSGLHDRVRLRGALPQHEVAETLRACDLFVLPSIIAADGQMEGIPVALMEAMASSKAVISTSISGIPELVADGECGILVDPGNPRHLATAIRRLLEDAQLRRSFGECGRKKVAAEFELRTCVTELAALFDRHNTPPDRDVVESLGSIAEQGVTYGVRSVSRGPDALVIDVRAAGDGMRELIVKRHVHRAGESRPPELRAADEWQLLQRLDGHFRGPALGAPRPLRLDGDVVAMTRVPGTQLHQILRAVRQNGNAARLRAAASGAGSWLDSFQHLQTGDGADAVRSLAKRARRDAEVVGAPARVVQRIDSLERELTASPPAAVSQHGDFWPGNVFVDGERVSVIDFEGYGLSLRAFDVTYFLLHASLYFSLRGSELMEVVRQGFFEGYRHPLDAAELELCRIATSLQLAAKDLRQRPLPHRLAISRVLRKELSR